MQQKIASTVLRIVFGLIFAMHGFAKFQNGLDNVAGFFGSLGLPSFLAYLVAILELIGGIALILGFAVRYISAAYALIMLGAIVKLKLANGLMGTPQAPGYEFELMLLAVAVFFVIYPQGWVDQLIASRKK